VQAQLPSPPPDGGYPNQNTAEGDNALFNLTTGFDNTAVGFNALFSNTTGFDNTATGAFALQNNTTGRRNTANGSGALFHNTTGNVNTANGINALGANTTGTHNTATGAQALVGNTTGNGNTAFGIGTLAANTTGSFNIAVGYNAGANLTTGRDNIDIGTLGVAGESNTMRIGNAKQTTTFITGISGVAVTGAPVMVNAAGQLGVAASSRRFKEAIKPMDKASEAILALKPVSFHYKKKLDPDGIPQFGLVAEQVAKVNPALITRDREGKPYTVRYDAVNAMLLNEFLKEHRKVQELEATIAQLKSCAGKQETASARQQRQIEALTAGLQRVSAQLEVSRPAPQVAAENP
jgi:hypothetical protein